jgi:hypothetical protein
MIIVWMLIAAFLVNVVIRIGDRAEQGSKLKKRSAKREKFKY